MHVSIDQSTFWIALPVFHKLKLSTPSVLGLPWQLPTEDMPAGNLLLYFPPNFELSTGSLAVHDMNSM